MIKAIETEYSVKDGGHYSPGIAYNGVLYISGQLSINPETGDIPEGGIKEETKQVLENLETVLKAANLSKENVIQCRVYIPDVDYWERVNEVYSEFFGSHKPARVVVPSNNLFRGCLVEIEAIASYEEVL